MSESLSTPDPGLLSINTATVRQQWRLPDIISGCAALGIRGIAPWRDQVAETGLKEAAQRIRDAGLFVSGYCRGGMFPAIDGALLGEVGGDLLDEVARFARREMRDQRRAIGGR